MPPRNKAPEPTGLPQGISRGADGTPNHQPGLRETAFGHENTPLNMDVTPAEKSARVGRMAGRIAQTHLAATPEHMQAGETFYSHDAHGTARAIAAGYDHGSPEHKYLAHTGGMTPSLERDYGNVVSHEQVKSWNGFQGDLAAHRERVNMNPHQFGGDIAKNVATGQARVADIAARHQEPGFADRAHRAAGALAISSPQTEWGLNKKQAFEMRDMERDNPKMLAQLRTDDRDYDNPVKEKGQVVPGKFNRLQVTRDSDGGKMALGSRPTDDILNGVDVMAGRKRPEDVVDTSENGKVKIGSFQTNIERPHDDADISKFPAPEPHDNGGRSGHDVTSDFRAHDIGTGRTLPANGNRGLSTGSTVTGARSASGRRYDEMVEAHHLATDYMNEHEAASSRVQKRPLEGLQTQGSSWFSDRVGTADRMQGPERILHHVQFSSRSGQLPPQGIAVSTRNPTRTKKPRYIEGAANKPAGQPARPEEGQ